jgi:hypothetical protein
MNFIPESVIYKSPENDIFLQSDIVLNDGGLKITSTTTGEYILINYPVRPYKTTHKLCVDIQKLEDNTYQTYDYGALYDTTSCECSFIVPSIQALAFDAFFRKYRNEDYILETFGTMVSGFYPFFPHRGNTGPFTVSCEILKFNGFQNAPYKYFKIDVLFKSTYGGVWPAFALPDLIIDGDIKIGDSLGSETYTTYIRYPEAGFEPLIDFSRFVTFDEKTEAYYDTHGANADQSATSFSTRMNTSTAARFFYFLFIIKRLATTIQMTAKNNQFPFGEHYGDNRPFIIQLIQDVIEVTHQEHNMFETELKFKRISG